MIFTKKNKLKKSNKQAGFTIIEILIVLPLVAILSLVISSTVFDQYGQLIQGSARARLRVEGETTLLSLEDELLFTTNYASVKSSDLVDPHAPTGGWTSNTTPTDTLIIYETALDSDRRDPDRDFIYKKSGACSSSYNIAMNNLMYFTTQNTTDQYRTLYRRTIVPAYQTCGVNFKNQTCPATAVVSPCHGADALLSTKVVDFQLEYLDEDNVTVTDPFDAELIKLRLTLGEKIYGENIMVTSTISMKKIN